MCRQRWKRHFTLGGGCVHSTQNLAANTCNRTRICIAVMFSSQFPQWGSLWETTQSYLRESEGSMRLKHHDHDS